MNRFRGLSMYGETDRPAGFFSNDGHSFVLTHQFSYTDAAGTKHIAPPAMVTDGGSIPRFFWRVIGGPFMFAVEAYIIHDRYCDLSMQEGLPYSQALKYRTEGDRLFREVLDYLAAGGRKHLPRWKRAVAHRAVCANSWRVMRRLARDRS